MSDDLVKRHIEQLRLTGGDLADLCQPLADAIEALIAERDEYKRLAAITETVARECKIHEARAEAAEAERDRLREALDNLLEALTAEDQFRDRAMRIVGPKPNLQWLLEAEDDAREALKGETP